MGKRTWIGKKDANGRKIMCGDWVMWWQGATSIDGEKKWTDLYYALKINLVQPEAQFIMGDLYNEFKGKEVVVLTRSQMKTIKEIDAMYPDSFHIKDGEFVKTQPWEEMAMTEENYNKMNEEYHLNWAKFLFNAHKREQL